jgi:hypothetical protein
MFTIEVNELLHKQLKPTKIEHLETPFELGIPETHIQKKDPPNDEFSRSFNLRKAFGLLNVMIRRYISHQLEYCKY